MTGVLIILGAFTVILVTAEVWARLGAKPEWTRKLVHLGGGLIGLALPWLIESPWVVLILTASLSALFLLGERLDVMKSLHKVERKTRGSEYYPLAIWLVFVIAADRKWLYVAAVLTLAVADAFAAIIGSSYGRHRYEVEDEFKSVEGSLACFVVAFLVIVLPLLFMTTLPRVTCVLSALLVAMLVTIFEAVSLRGTDNLFVPIAAVFVLQKITTKTPMHIAMQNVALIVIVALMLVVAHRIAWFNIGGALTVTLFLYAAWSLAPHLLYIIPAFIGLVLLLAVRVIMKIRGERRRFKVRAATRSLMLPFLFLLAANMSGKFDAYYPPYLVACALVFAYALSTFIRARQ